MWTYFFSAENRDVCIYNALPDLADRNAFWAARVGGRARVVRIFAGRPGLRVAHVINRANVEIPS